MCEHFRMRRYVPALCGVLAALVLLFGRTILAMQGIGGRRAVYSPDKMEAFFGTAAAMLTKPFFVLLLIGVGLLVARWMRSRM